MGLRSLYKIPLFLLRDRGMRFFVPSPPLSKAFDEQELGTRQEEKKESSRHDKTP
jgi:hypothetical protein